MLDNLVVNCHPASQVPTVWEAYPVSPVIQHDSTCKDINCSVLFYQTNNRLHWCFTSPLLEISFLVF